MTWHIRDFRSDDVSFVFDTWLRSYGQNRPNPWQRLDFHRFMKGHRAIIDSLLARPSTRLRVACANDAEHVILGWACSEPGVLHYMYVKRKFRQKGVASAMVEDAGAPALYSHAPTSPQGPHTTVQMLRAWGMKESPGHLFYPPLKEEAE